MFRVDPRSRTRRIVTRWRDAPASTGRRDPSEPVLESTVSRANVIVDVRDEIELNDRWTRSVGDGQDLLLS